MQSRIQSLKERGRKEHTARLTLEPVRIVWQDGEIENAEALLQQRSRQISLGANDPMVMKSRPEKKAAVLLDFGSEIHGGIRILCWGTKENKDARIRVRFGESVTEAMSETGGESNATNDHARRDMELTLGMMSMNPVGETGFRFVRIDLLEDVTLQLKTITAVLVYKDVPYRGSFRCNDELLNRIWDVGAYTVHLNMQEYVWDGIKRDRLVWVGDMHPETLAIRTVFGGDDAVERSLDFIRQETPLPGWMNNMAAYTMWYVIIVRDWFLYTGNFPWIEQQKEYLLGVAHMLSAHIDEEGKDTVKDGRFMDWPSSEKPGITDAGIQAIHYMAADALEALLHMLGEEEAAGECARDKERLKGYAVDYEDSKPAAALLVLAGMQDAKQVNERLLSVGGAQGMSSFMGYYILAAKAMAGDFEGCLNCIRDYWGGMLSLGATTFWEDFDVEWLKGAAPIDRLPEEGEIDIHGTYGSYCYRGMRHSLCHGWAGGATPWLTEYVLGARILEPGCRRIAVEPHLGDLEWAEGMVPTPHGNVHIRVCKDEAGRTAVDTEAPEGITVEKII